MISGTMFGALLFIAGLSMRLLLGIASLRSGAFRDNLRKRDFTVQVKTEDREKARYYRLVGGKLRSRGSEHSEPDLSLVWVDSPSFFRAVIRPNPLLMAKGLTGALSDGILTIEADIEATAWFMSEMGEMIGVYRNFFSG